MEILAQQNIQLRTQQFFCEFELSGDSIIEGNFCFGIGITGISDNEQVLSQGLPVDVISMFQTAKRLSNKTPLKEKQDQQITYVVLADAVAIDLGLDQKQVNKTTQHYQTAIQKVLKELGMQQVCEVLLASELQLETGFQEEYDFVEQLLSQRQIDSRFIRYLTFQTALITHLRKTKNVVCKIGWLLEKEIAKMSNYLTGKVNELMYEDGTPKQDIQHFRRDELWFDSMGQVQLDETFPKLKHVYCLSGIGLNGLMKPPYTHFDDDDRQNRFIINSGNKIVLGSAEYSHFVKQDLWKFFHQKQPIKIEFWLDILNKLMAQD